MKSRGGMRPGSRASGREWSGAVSTIATTRVAICHLERVQVTPDQVSFLTNASGAAQTASGQSGLLRKSWASMLFLAAHLRAGGERAHGRLGFHGRDMRASAAFPTSCPRADTANLFVPASYQTLASQEGNFPVFEGTSLYSLRIDHNVSNNNRLTLRANVSPSTVTGIEVSGEDQPFGQNAYSRTSQQTYRDVAGVVQDTWTIGNNKVNEFRFQYARRGLAYFYNTAIPGGSDPAMNIPGYAYFGREPYSYIRRVEQRYQFTDNFAWTQWTA